MYKVCFISTQNTVKEKFCYKTFLTSVFLHIISIFTSAMLFSHLLPIWSKCFSQKPVHWFAEKINGLVLFEKTGTKWIEFWEITFKT